MSAVLNSIRDRLAGIRFNRNELSGSFGDIGTDLPLIIGMMAAVGLDSASVFVTFGAMQILTGLVYGLPMPVQPLKAMAVLVITQKIGYDSLAGAGLAIGAIMIGLSATGILNWLEKVVPTCVVRGIQFGLGMALASLALKTYLPAMGWTGYGIAVAAFAMIVVLWNNHRIPAGLVVVLFGIGYAAVLSVDYATIGSSLALTWPAWHQPTWDHVLSGLVVLALPQLPLSLSNSVIATSQTVKDLFPERKLSVSKIGITYGLMNMMVPFFGGVPVCHGCGGMAGHYAFGARTGGSVIIYGSIYVLLGLFVSGAITHLVQVFPQPILAVILLVEALTLMMFARDQASTTKTSGIVLLVGVLAFALPHGFIIGLVVGCLVYYASSHFLSDRKL